MSDITEIAPLAPDAGIDELRQALAQLIENQRVRERDTAGEKAAKFITWGDAEAVGLVIRVGGGSVGTGGGVYTPPDDPLLDLSPPEAATNLQAFSSVAYVMVTVDPPTYPQGGGNGYTEIYAANYAGTGPLPTFGDAVLIGTMTGRSPVLVIDAEPGVEMHFWAGAVTTAGVKQVDTIGPTGGTNGVTATPGLIDSQHIVSLTASKITAGSVAVGEDITSTGFVPGSAGWRIRGNGAAEFSNVVARGSIYASFGAIGGALIGSTYVQSSNYNGTNLGWMLDNTTGKIYAYGVELSGDMNITGGSINLASAGSGARTHYETDRIRVFDASGTLRVKIGNLA